VNARRPKNRVHKKQVRRSLRCAQHGKLIFGSEQQALEYLMRIWGNPDQHREKIPVRAYLGTCMFWHVTSETISEYHRRAQ
jgi:hypothetical protein